MKSNKEVNKLVEEITNPVALRLKELYAEIEEYEETVEDKDGEITELEKRPEIEVENLREQMILEKFAELFAKKDYNTMEAMLDSYELL